MGDRVVWGWEWKQEGEIFKIIIPSEFEANGETELGVLTHPNNVYTWEAKAGEL